MKGLYLLVDLAVFAGPFALSFDRKVHFVGSWRSFWPANLLVLAGFIAWDISFTREGIWGFNPDHLIGLNLAGLPIEEWLFFIVVPYASVFTYATLKAYLRHRNPFRWSHYSLSFTAFVLCIWLAIHFQGARYIETSAWLTAAGLLGVMATRQLWMAWFWLAFLVLVVPFVLSNGVLTGITFWEYPLLHRDAASIADHIVWYNPDHNTGWRIFSMPADDLVYGFLLLGLNVGLFEALERRRLGRVYDSY